MLLCPHALNNDIQVDETMLVSYSLIVTLTRLGTGVGMGEGEG